MKRAVSFVLVLVMTLSLLQMTAFAEPAVVAQGTSKEVAWVLTEDGTLTVSGSGRMDDVPAWSDYAGQIRRAVVCPGVTYVGGWAFANCTSLVDVSLSDSVTQVSYGAFNNCSSLVSIKLPSGLTRIGGRCFEGCTSLRDVNIPSGVTKIEDSVFAGCTSLTKIKLPSGIKYLESGAFWNCSISEINIPSGVTLIGIETFADCRNLKQITIPASVSEIAWLAFSDCTSLASITFKGNAPYFSESIFRGVTATVYYPVDDPTWTADIMQSYDGNIAWIPLGAPEEEEKTQEEKPPVEEEKTPVGEEPPPIGEEKTPVEEEKPSVEEEKKPVKSESEKEPTSDPQQEDTPISDVKTDEEIDGVEEQKYILSEKAGMLMLWKLARSGEMPDALDYLDVAKLLLYLEMPE